MKLEDNLVNTKNSKEMTDEDITKYDRQIRLFGFETQSKLLSFTIQILGPINYTSSEILKNLTLLGVKKIIVRDKLLEYTKKLVPDDLTRINKNLIIEISEVYKKSDFLFIVDEMPDLLPESVNYYFACSKCLSILFSDSNHECVLNDNMCIVACYCLLGAFAVQEFLKFVQEHYYAKIYKIEI